MAFRNNMFNHIYESGDKITPDINLSGFKEDNPRNSLNLKILWYFSDSYLLIKSMES